MQNVVNYHLFNILDVHGRVAVQKPLLNLVQIRKRLSWCQLYLKMDGNLWDNVIFSDEVHIQLYSKQRQYVHARWGIVPQIQIYVGILGSSSYLRNKWLACSISWPKYYWKFIVSIEKQSSEETAEDIKRIMAHY